MDNTSTTNSNFAPFIGGESPEELLQFLIAQGKIDVEDALNNMKISKKLHIIEQHKLHYQIWQGNDGRWRTYVFDASKPKERRMLVKSSRENLDNAIVDFYMGGGLISPKNKPKTIREIYPLWMEYRRNTITCSATLKRNSQDWTRYYINDPIIDIPLEQLSKLRMDDWIHTIIEEYQLSKKEYYNMSLIMRKCWQYAVDDNIIADNAFAKVHVNTKKFRKIRKPDNKTAVYMDNEAELVTKYAYSLFEQNPKNITALAIPLLFQTGMRAGEIVALTWDDISNNTIHVWKTESVNYDMQADGSFAFSGTIVVDHAKTDAGDRYIPLTTPAREILNLVRKSSLKYGFYDENYIFCPNSKRVRANSLDKKLYYYCNKLSLPPKSTHKIRKNYISKLVESGELDIDTIRKVAGHEDTKTTFNSYCFNIHSDEATYEKFERVLG